MFWRETYPEAYIQDLPRLHSDHNPLLISLTSTMIPEAVAKPVRFQKMCSSHANFIPAIQTFKLSNSQPLDQKITAFQDYLKLWNHNTFGNPFRRKKSHEVVRWHL